jgi:hypothetical protein
MRDKVFRTNIEQWLDVLRPDHWEHGKTWYRQAHQLCLNLSNETNLELRSVCGVMAALSPQVSWEVNIASGESVVRAGKIDKGYTGYSSNVEKAYDCLLYEPLDILKGFKVVAFYHNILDPFSSIEVTVDTHMGRVLFDKLTLEEKDQRYIFSKKGNHEAQEAIRAIAKKKQVLPHVLQASLWVCVREMTQKHSEKQQLDLYVK